METYILKGDPAEVAKVIRENRIRISRGVISITPAEQEQIPEIDKVNSAVIPDEDGEKSTESVPNTKESESSGIMDEKDTDTEDFKEVNIDSDAKQSLTEDVKEVPIEDMKEASPPKKATRSKRKED